MNQDFVLDYLTNNLKAFGFKFNKSALIWWKSNDEVLQLIHFQKSSWGPEYYLNFGLYFEGLKPLEKKPPRNTSWHLQARYEAFFELDNEERLKRFKREGSNEILEKNLKIICKDMNSVIIPIMEKLSDYRFLLDSIKGGNGTVHGFHVTNFPIKTYEAFLQRKIKESDVT